MWAVHTFERTEAERVFRKQLAEGQTRTIGGIEYAISKDGDCAFQVTDNHVVQVTGRDLDDLGRLHDLEASRASQVAESDDAV